MNQQTTVTQQNSDYYTPMNQLGSSILYLTNPEDLIEQLKLIMRSSYLNTEGQPIRVGEPLINELGIASVIGQIQSIVNQVTIMSNLDRNQIDALRDNLGITLAQDLMINHRKYTIKDHVARTKIYHSAIRVAFICMMRAYESGERRFWKGQQPQEMRTVMEGTSGGKKGGLLRFIGWGK